MSSAIDFNIEICLASNTQTQIKPVLESLNTETKTNFLLTDSSVSHSTVGEFYLLGPRDV